jgi:predicted ArsR family transcriptional regulator
MATKTGPMNDERDEQSGQFKQKYDPDQLIEAVREQGGGATASEVADRLDAPRRSIHTRLAALHDDGRLGKRNVGPSVLWTLADGETA